MNHTQCVLCGNERLESLGYLYNKLVRCLACSVVFDERIPSQRELLEHYTQYERAQSFDSPISRKRRQEILLALSPYRQAKRLLDVGCGVGAFLDEAKELGWETFGAEYTQEAVEVCQSNGHSMHLGPILSAAFPDNHFDVVIYSEVIEHINNQPLEFAEVHRILRPGGMLYVTTPNFNALERRLLGEKWNVIQYPEHLVYFTPRTLHNLLAPLGFERQRILTSGVSVSRIQQSLRPYDESRKTHQRQHRSSSDEKLRAVTEYNPIAGQLKNLVNQLLNVTQLGKTIRAWYMAQ